jgi:hypothetical protein
VRLQRSHDTETQGFPHAVRLTQEVKERVEARARLERRSVAGLLAVIIEDAVKAAAPTEPAVPTAEPAPPRHLRDVGVAAFKRSIPTLAAALALAGLAMPPTQVFADPPSKYLCTIDQAVGFAHRNGEWVRGRAWVHPSPKARIRPPAIAASPS